MTKTLILATTNAGKAADIREILAAHGVTATVQTLADLPDFPEVVEDGTTFRDNATKKVAALAVRYPEAVVLADDSGLAITALGGAPGVLSARYAGDHDDAANITKVLAEMANVPQPARTAQFMTTMVLRVPGVAEDVVSTGIVEGYITTAPFGDNGFGYDPIFYVAEPGKTFAELTLAEKNQQSHRSRALTGMLPALMTALSD